METTEKARQRLITLTLEPLLINPNWLKNKTSNLGGKVGGGEPDTRKLLYVGDVKFRGVSSFTQLTVVGIDVTTSIGICLDISINRLRNLDSLLNPHHMVAMNLCSNLLESLNGLEQCENLCFLNCSQNKLKNLESLRCCYKLQHLNASSNLLTSVSMENPLIDELKYPYAELNFIELNDNPLLSTLEGIASFGKSSLYHIEIKACGFDSSYAFEPLIALDKVKTLYIDSNHIESLSTLDVLLKSSISNTVQSLSLAGNPFMLNINLSHYLVEVLSLCANLSFLDYMPIDSHAKVQLKQLKQKTDNEVFLEKINFYYTQEISKTTRILSGLEEKHRTDEALIEKVTRQRIRTLENELEAVVQYAKDDLKLKTDEGKEALLSTIRGDSKKKEDESKEVEPTEAK